MDPPDAAGTLGTVCVRETSIIRPQRTGDMFFFICSTNRWNDWHAYQFKAGGLLEVYVPGRPKLCKRLLGQLCGFNLGLLMCHLTVVVGRQHFDASKIGQVYPRVYGGTANRYLLLAYRRGLSPRVRGNQTRARAGHVQDGSIPACTGEPGRRGPIPGSGRVYPRVYGGTWRGSDGASTESGLSPRVRGNPPRPLTRDCRMRSIPACTGEPLQLHRMPVEVWVYPRVYGGTRRAVPDIQIEPGLSPRVRGNRSGAASR